MPSSDYGCVRFWIFVAYSSRTAVDFTVIFHVQSHYRAMFVPVSECHCFFQVTKTSQMVKSSLSRLYRSRVLRLNYNERGRALDRACASVGHEDLD